MSEERIRELEIAKIEALGHLLGCVDVMAWTQEHPNIFKVEILLPRLLAARTNYDAACTAYRAAREAAS